MALTSELTFHTEELSEISDFVERNLDRLKQSPKFSDYLSKLLVDPNAYILFQDAEGFHLEPGMPMLNAMAAMRRGGCR